MGTSLVLLLAVVALGVAVYGAVSRRAVVAAIATAVFVLLAIVWAGEVFGFLNV